MAISAARSASECANASSRSYMEAEGSNPAPEQARISITLGSDMESTVEESGRHTVVLTVEVPPEEFARDLDRAYRRISQQVKIPGFRKGHVPRKIIDAQIGRETVMQ